ncbi:hypothetical protein Fmac_020357 [Flemingia macrophylla]|uniref:Uncharacterized protein n=1 Tax=Flemingia macrophylla TaxID=520843 RepID=A0ABD1LVM9_9FABA
MGNKNSTTSSSKAQYRSQGQGAKVTYASTEPHFDVATRKRHTTPKVVSRQAEPHGKKPLVNDDTFSTYIKHAKNKLKNSKSNIGAGGHEERSNTIPMDVTSGTNKKQENERDHFSDFITNARKKLRTVTRRNSSFRRGE